jgi:hypothetical protein
LFCPDKFAAIQEQLGIKFTLDACCNPDGNNKLVDKYCSTSNDFLKYPPLPDEVMWINAPFNSLQEFISRYTDLKSVNPGLSACLVVPEWKGPHVALLRGMTPVVTYAIGTRLFYAPTDSDERILMPGIPFKVTVYYDPPKLPKHHVLTVGDVNDVTMLFDATVSGAKARACIGTPIGTAMMDSAAQGEFLSHAYVKMHGIAVKPEPADIRMADGVTPLPSSGVAVVHLTIGPYKRAVRCLVVDLPDGVDIILGDPWLKQHKALLDYDRAAVTIRKGNRRITLRARKSVAPAVPQAAPKRFLSAIQLKKAARAGCRMFLVHVSKLEGGGEQPAKQVEGLLAEYADRFPADLPPGLPPHRNVTHTIPLQPGSSPPFRAMYRLSFTEREEVEATIKDLLDKGYIEPSCSPYGAPILFVGKKDGTLRMCMDYRALNKLTVKNRYPLPRIDDLLDQLHGATVFSSLDLASGYHQVRITEDDVPKTAFRTPFGHFQWRVLPFGLSNAPSTFQAMMNDVFGPEFRKFVCVYLDDVLVFSKTPEEHTKHLKLVLEALRKAQLYAKLSKCSFFQDKVDFLGFVVGAGTLSVDPKKVQAVVDWPEPQDVHQVRSFLGLMNYFRKFIQGYSAQAAPLNELLQKGSKFTFDAPQRLAFEAMKAALTSAPLLALPDFVGARGTKPFVVTTDASDYGIGAVLTQDGHPIAFESRKLTPYEATWTTTEKEMLAIVHALTVWRCYLDGVHFTVHTDHNANVHFHDKPQLSSRRQARWSELLSSFDFEIKYKPGKNNVADP